MGTRALVNVFEGGKQVACIYRQFDGYISGLGADLAGIMAGKEFVNGMRDNRAVFNGMGCFAAQVVAGLKDRPGNVYLYPPGSRDVGEEYVYEFRGGYEEPAAVAVRVLAYDKEVFSGDVPGFLAFVAADGDENAA